MNRETIQELLGRRPFEPFEVYLSSGEVHAVRHPEFAILLPSRLVVADPVTDRLSILSFLHIAELRMLQPQSGR
jgi:hypothetical protein